MEAAQVCRARQKADVLHDYPLPYWAEKVHLLASAVYQRAENETMEEDADKENGNPTQFQITGSGDSGAFSLIHQSMMEAKEKRKNGR